MPLRRLLPLAIALSLAGTATAETGWSSSPVVTLPRPRYSVLGATPGCEGQVLVDVGVRRFLDPFARGGLAPDAPSRASRAVGDALNLLGLDTVLQDHAICAEVCARIPADASRIVHLLAHADQGSGTPMLPVPFDRWSDYVHWEPEIDTTRIDADGRLVCARVRHWLERERRVFLVVGYER